MTVKILRFLDNLNHKKFNKFLYYFLLPVFFCIEYYLYRKYWKIILNEIGSSEEVVNWFDNEEFALTSNKLWKKDIIDIDSFLDSLDLVELQVKIKGEFSKRIVDLFTENLQLDIENYINLMVIVEYSKESTDKLKQYTTIIRYYRYQAIVDSIKWLVLWLLTTGLIISTLLYFIK